MKISTTPLLYLLALQVVVGITIVLDIPFARQISGFIYLAFIMGFIVIRVLGLKPVNTIETLLFSVGLSISFLMFIGLLVNSFGSLGLISHPLSTEPLFIGISIFTISLSVLSCFKDPAIPAVIATDFKISDILLYLSFPLFTIFGMLLVKAFNNNFLLFLVIITISISFFFVSISGSSSKYPFLLATIALSLLLMTYLTSNYINGYDVHWEYINFQITKDASYWNPLIGLEKYVSNKWPLYVSQSMLSDTILPTIFSNILNVESEIVSNILYPVIFSLMPLGLYQLFQQQWENKQIALLSSLFFVSNFVFFGYRNNVRLMVAILFFVLLFIVLLNKEMEQRSKWILLICFSFGLIVSYYSLTYLFLFLIFFTWLFMKIINKTDFMQINFKFVSLFSVMTFLWYIYVTGGAFDRLQLFITTTYSMFVNNFFNPQSRGAMVLSTTNISNQASFFHLLGTLLFDLTALLILIGFITLIAKRTKKRIDPEFSLLISLSMATLLMAVILPHFAYDFQMDKLYLTSLLFISPLFVIGGKTIFNNVLKVFSLKKRKRETSSLILILIVLATFFLFQSGFVYEVTNDATPSSIALSKYRMDEYTRIELSLVDESNFFGAMWLSNYLGVNNAHIYSDTASKYKVLMSYMVDANSTIRPISNETIFWGESYLYLSRYNTMNNIFLYDTNYPKFITYNMSDFSIFKDISPLNNRIYSNGACEIYYFSNSD